MGSDGELIGDSASRETREALLADLLADVAKDSGWNAIKGEPLRHLAVGAPDLLLISPQNRGYLVELKLGNQAAHFAELAQVSRHRKALAAWAGTMGLLPSFGSIIGTSAIIAAGYAGMAKKLGIEVVGLGEDLRRDAETLFSRLVEADIEATA